MEKREKRQGSLLNFGLLESEFNNLCDNLKSGDEMLFETIFLTHFESAVKYLIQNKGASYNDAYDVVMNVLIEFRKRILDDKVQYGNLKFMFTQMCVQRYSKEKGSEIRLSEYYSLKQYQDHYIDEELYLLLEKSMNALGEQCQKIIEDIYFLKLTYRSLEEVYQTSAASLRKRKERCLATLKLNLRRSLSNL